MNPFIYDLRYLKYRFIQAYFHFQLLQAQKLTDEGKGHSCVVDVDVVAEVIDKVKNIIEEKNNTYEEIIQVIKYNPHMRDYYNTIGATVQKHFKAGDGWIPSFLAIEVFRIFGERGYSDFNDINFVELQAYYQKHENRKEHNYPQHYKCAEDIYKTIMAKKIFKKKRKKQGK